MVNAFAMHVLRSRYVFILSDLADLYLSNNKEEELNFIIGHELAHHALGHTHPIWDTIRRSCSPTFLFFMSIFCMYIGFIQQAMQNQFTNLTFLIAGCLFIASIFSVFIFNAYSRACELSCDRVGKALIDNNIEAAQTALIAITNGSESLYSQTNITEFINQEKAINQVFAFLYQIFSAYPRMTKRIQALNE